MLRTGTRLFCVALIGVSAVWWTESVQAQSANPLKLAYATGEEPLAVILWNGFGEAKPDSSNRTQKLLAEQSLRDFAKDVSVQQHKFFSLITRLGNDDEPDDFASILFTLTESAFVHPSMITLNHVGARPGELRFAMVIDAGKEIDIYKKALDQMIDLAYKDEPDDVSVVEIAGEKFYRIPGETDIPLSHLGTLGSRLVFAWGDDTIEPLIARLQQPKTPKWIEPQLADLPVDQPNLLAYVNVKQIIASLEKAGAIPNLQAITQASGLDTVSHVSLVGGLDATGMRVNTLVSFQGEPRGLLALLPNKPLTIDNFRRVPASASGATVVRFDLDQALSHLRGLETVFSPEFQRLNDARFDRFQQKLGFSVRKHLAEGLGDEWTLYTAGDAGGAAIVPPLVLSVSIRDASKIQPILDAVVRDLKKSPEGYDEGDPLTVHEYTVKGTKAVRVQINNFPVAMTPAWVLTKDEFVLSLQPQLLYSHLAQPGKPSLADSEILQAAFKQQPNPVLVNYSDPKPRVRSIYSLINTFGPVITQQFDELGIEVTPPVLPPLSDLEPHLQPGVTTFYFSKDGLRSETRGVVPSGFEGGPASVEWVVGSLFPALEESYKEGRQGISKNNMKQLGLGLLILEDAKGRYPGQAIRDKKGNALLSWRVRILPYLDQGDLYKQFRLNEPWDSEHNKTLIEKMPHFLSSPNHPELHKQGKTTYLAPIAKGTLWENPAGSRLRDVIDGSSNTILLVEAPADNAVIWTKPEDLPIDLKDPRKHLKSVRPGGFQALFGDGSVIFISDSLDVDILRGLFTYAGEEDVQSFWNDEK